MRSRIVFTLGPSIVTWAAAAFLPGCGVGHVAEPDSPTVSADSEAGKKAREEDERLRNERKQQEAKARKRVPTLPAEG